jgi:hypothetical protein
MFNMNRPTDAQLTIIHERSNVDDQKNIVRSNIVNLGESDWTMQVDPVQAGVSNTFEVVSGDILIGMMADGQQEI